MKTEANDPINPDKDYGNIGSIGLTKREYFAAQAMIGYLSAFPSTVNADPEIMVQMAVKYADTLIKELNK